MVFMHGVKVILTKLKLSDKESPTKLCCARSGLLHCLGRWLGELCHSGRKRGSVRHRAPAAPVSHASYPVSGHYCSASLHLRLRSQLWASSKRKPHDLLNHFLRAAAPQISRESQGGLMMQLKHRQNPPRFG